MKGATMLATLQALEIMPSFSRPAVNNDNPYSEALFKTLKYRPAYPVHPFADAGAARQWATGCGVVQPRPPPQRHPVRHDRPAPRATGYAHPRSTQGGLRSRTGATRNVGAAAREIASPSRSCISS